MTEEKPKIRQNYLAIVVAAIACFLFEAVWYSYFLRPWLSGIDRTQEWLMTQGANPEFQYGTALVCAGVIAAAISYIVQYTGPQTAARGIRIGALLWFSMVLTTWSTEYVFEIKPWSLLGINAGFWAFGMMIMGWIVGGWKKKEKA
ncbi:MAG: DUF1761 domain-containing protein [Terracidiphilus sp.]